VTRAPRSASDRGTARITVYPDGPLIVRGEFVLEDLDEGQLPTGRLIALCRCGRSATKPLCDGSHKIARSNRAAPNQPPEP
jgi:CDGSH-type Zn-finger protein